MYRDQVLKNTFIANNTKFAIAKSTVKQEKYQVEYQNIQIPDLALSLAPLGFILVWAIFIIVFHKMRSYRDEKVYLKGDFSTKVPCKKCQFYANNHYLKCAVKPDSVLTEKAIDCSEYTPKKKGFPPKNFFR